MKWHSFIEEQIKQCIEHPAGSAAGTTIFGGIAGMQLAQLLDKASVRILDYVFALLFAALASGQAYLLAKALQLLRYQADGRPVQHRGRAYLDELTKWSTDDPKSFCTAVHCDFSAFLLTLVPCGLALPSLNVPLARILKGQMPLD